MRGLIPLSNGRPDGSSQKEKKEQSGTQHTCAEPIHEKALLRAKSQYENGDACRSVIRITSHRNAIFARAVRSAYMDGGKSPKINWPAAIRRKLGIERRSSTGWHH
jgi:hypothetical protein